MTYEWLNPPAGTFTAEEYLLMHEYWMESVSGNRNELSVKVDPLKKRFFGNKSVTVEGDTVTLSAL